VFLVQVLSTNTLALLGAPVVKGKGQDTAITREIEELDSAMKRLTLLHMHDALTLLKNSLTMPKVLYLLRTADCSGNQLLERFDDTLRSGISRVLNVDLDNDQWLQASLSIRDGGLGSGSAVLRCWHLLPFWPLLHLHMLFSSPSFQTASTHWREDPSVASTDSKWSSVAGPAQQLIAGDERHIQKEWDKLVAENHQAQLFLRAVSDLDKTWLLAAASHHSGDWLHVPPIASVGLTLSDEAVRAAVAHRLRCKACEPHTCTCGKAVDTRDLHGLSSR